MNKLGRWLEEQGIARSAFAALVPCSPSAVTALCKEPPDYWPSKAIVLRIRDLTGGAVSAEDFLPPFAAGDMPGEAGCRERSGLEVVE